ncbi:hypothetical protein [Rhizobacter sp. Root404]|uniref:hypothetical protein n=1 Tax=Rhizobacter sp. Root404 TaxID=1736528 RepID=UPI0006F87678|nr:hypothetical protein [Rhizobacter sp. Root404]KQW36743.1 hypothetical protein ASC76_19090 [Rhizobacter sp. Root404]
MNYFANLAALSSEMPRLLQLGVGHVLPLYATIWAIWSMRGSLRSEAFVRYAFALLAVTLVMLQTSHFQISRTASGGASLGLLVYWGISVLAGCGVAVGMKRCDWRAIVPMAFLPIWFTDLVQAIPLLAYMNPLTGIGGAGLADALVIAPVGAMLFAPIVMSVYSRAVRCFKRGV